MRAIHVLRNPSGGSRRSRTDAAALRSSYRHLGFEMIDLTGTDVGDSRHRVEDALDRRAVERLVVAGGDGLVHLAVQHLPDSGIPLGILPSGTGNDFAAALGIDEATPERTLADPIAVDVIDVETSDGAHHIIASVAIAGFPARINKRANESRVRLGPAVYTLAAAAELPHFGRDRVELEIDGDSIVSDTAMLAIGNTKFFGGGMLACPDARHDDGLLHLTSIEGVGRLGILRHLAGRRGGTADRPEVLRRTASVIRIATPGLALWGDGEQVAVTPAILRVRPGGLLVAGARPQVPGELRAESPMGDE